MWTALALGAAWVYKNRQRIRNRLGSVEVLMKPADLNAEGRTVYISAASGGRSSATATLTVRKDTDLRWKVEAPTPSLARRLEELVAWYIHVS